MVDDVVVEEDKGVVLALVLESWLSFVNVVNPWPTIDESQSTPTICCCSDWSTKFRMSFTENGVEKLLLASTDKALVLVLMVLLLLLLHSGSNSN